MILAAALTFVGGLLSIAINLSFNLAGLIGVVNTSAGPVISLPAPWVWGAVVAGGIVIGLATLLLFRRAFRGISGVDGAFSTPATFALVAIVGLVLVFLGFTFFLDGLYSAVSCSGTGQPITGPCLFNAPFWGGIALLFIGAIAALAGYIGVLLGIWRLGTHFHDSLFKAGAILLIFPYVNLVAALLIVFAAYKARQRIEAPGTALAL